MTPRGPCRRPVGVASWRTSLVPIGWMSLLGRRRVVVGWSRRVVTRRRVAARVASGWWVTCGNIRGCSVAMYDLYLGNLPGLAGSLGSRPAVRQAGSCKVLGGRREGLEEARGDPGPGEESEREDCEEMERQQVWSGGRELTSAEERGQAMACWEERGC